MKLPLGALQVELTALPPMLPPKFTVPPSQIVCGNPALAIGARFTVTTTLLVAATQGPAPSGSFEAKFKVTVPDAIDGVYVEVNELMFEKLPVPDVHVELVALPPMLPAKVIVPPPQTVCGAPALAVGA